MLMRVDDMQLGAASLVAAQCMCGSLIAQMAVAVFGATRSVLCDGWYAALSWCHLICAFTKVCLLQN